MDDAIDRVTRLERGSLFAGYRIEGQLDRGGMGVVYKAADPDLDRTVALKIIAPEHTQNPDAVARFKVEARLAASLEHPNIVPIHRGGEFEGVLYLAMRFVPGTNLRKVVDEGQLDLPRIGRITTAVAAALDAAHERGLVHRDVKPGNILLSGSGEHEHVYLTDFGLTKRLGSAGSLTRPGAWVGTPDYVAPEQIQAGKVDGRADIYSLGCVLYEMLTGSVAFPKDNDMAKLWAHVTDPPPSPSLARPELVKDFDEVVARATAKDPDERFPRASDLAAAVDRAIAAQDAQLASGGLQETRAATGLSPVDASKHDLFIAEPTRAPGNGGGRCRRRGRGRSHATARRHRRSGLRRRRGHSAAARRDSARRRWGRSAPEPGARRRGSADKSRASRRRGVKARQAPLAGGGRRGGGRMRHRGGRGGPHRQLGRRRQQQARGRARAGDPEPGAHQQGGRPRQDHDDAQRQRRDGQPHHQRTAEQRAPRDAHPRG